MDKLEKIKKQLKKQIKELKILQNAKFQKNKDDNLNKKLLTFVGREYQYKKGEKIKAIILSQMDYLNQVGQKPNFSSISKILFISNKTAKKYGNIVEAKKDLTHKNRGNIPHNKTPEKIYLGYINTIHERIKEVYDYAGIDFTKGKKMFIMLTHVVDDIETRLPSHKRVKLGTIRKWLNNNTSFVLKHNIQKRTQILQKIKKINERIAMYNKL